MVSQCAFLPITSLMSYLVKLLLMEIKEVDDCVTDFT